MKSMHWMWSFHRIPQASAAGIAYFEQNPDLAIEDCGSSVGTYVDGRKLTPHTSNRLVSGQKVVLGSSKSFEVM